MDIKLPERRKTGHKGNFGTAAVFGGQKNQNSVMLGGPAFAANAALRSGVGLVNFIGPGDLLAELIKMVPQAVGYSDIDSNSKNWGAIIIGPGLEKSPENELTIEKLLALKKPTVIDAGGLNILADSPNIFRLVHEKCVLTPHPKELSRLIKGLSLSEPKDLIEKNGCCLVLKSNVTEVISKNEHWLLEGNNPILATGGTGDVLAGLIGGLLAQYSDEELSIFECAKAGIYIHSQAAKEWRKQHGNQGLIIEELLELVPSQIDSLRKS